MAEHFKALNRKFKWLAHAEGISFLLILFVTMPLKYGFDVGTPNKVIGMAHGLLFIGYIVFALVLSFEERWPFKKLFLALLASILPFGTFYFVKKYGTSRHTVDSM